MIFATATDITNALLILALMLLNLSLVFQVMNVRKRVRDLEEKLGVTKPA
jgi:hypothetical protein